MRQVNLYANGEALDLLPDTSIVLTQQVNDIAELQDRQANYSNQFTLPKTTTNMRVLNDKHKKHPAQLEQYGALTNGYLVIQSEDVTYKAVFYSGAINFFQLIEGMKLKDLDMTELEHILNVSNIVASHTNDWNDGYIYPFLNTANDDSVYDYTNREVWAKGMIPCIYTRYILKKIVDSVDWKIQGRRIEEDKIAKSVIPFVYNNGSATFLKSEVQASAYYQPSPTDTSVLSIIYPFVGRDTQYNLISNPANNLGSGVVASPNIIIPYDTINLDEATQIDTDAIAYESGYTFPNAAGCPSTPPASTKTHIAKCTTKFDASLTLGIFSTSGGLTRRINDPYTPSATGLTYLRTFTQIQNVLEIRLVAYTQTSRSTESPYRTIHSWKYNQDYSALGTLNLFASDLIMYKDERLGVVAYVNNQQVGTFNTYPPTPYAIYYSDVNGLHIGNAKLSILNTSIQGDESYPTQYSNYWAISSNLPDMTIKDFLKALAQRFCWIYEADSPTQTLRVISFQDIYDNIAYAKDWSDKVEAGAFVLDSHCNYAQVNDAVFSEDNAPKLYGNSTFDIKDNSLVARKKSLETGLSSTFFTTRWNGISICDFAVWGDSYSTTTFFPNKYKAHILGVYTIPIGSVAQQVKIKNTAGSYTIVQNNLPFAFFENVQNFPIEYDYTMQDAIENEYAALIRSLNNYELITENVWLTAQDFIGFNPFIPVYIRKHQAYFYVNKIMNFVDGKVTKVELLKLI